MFIHIQLLRDNIKISKSFFWGGLHPQQIEVPRLGVESELQLSACTTATAMPDLSCVCNLHHSSWQRQMLNLLSKARDQTPILMVTSRVHYCWATIGTSLGWFKGKRNALFLEHMRLRIAPISKCSRKSQTYSSKFFIPWFCTAFVCLFVFHTSEGVPQMDIPIYTNPMAAVAWVL